VENYEGVLHGICVRAICKSEIDESRWKAKQFLFLGIAEAILLLHRLLQLFGSHCGGEFGHSLLAILIDIESVCLNEFMVIKGKFQLNITYLLHSLHDHFVDEHLAHEREEAHSIVACGDRELN
jgi:hypothetical protein